MSYIWKILKKVISIQGSSDSSMLEKEFGLSERISNPSKMGYGPLWMKF